MHLSSVNLAQPRPMPGVKAVGITGIYKQPVAQAWVGRDGLRGDAVCDTENHGGVDQAVYVFGTSDYDWWSNALGQQLAPGTFGENLTISGLESALLAIGDRLEIGKVLLEITSPRIPCVTLAKRMDDPQFVKKFRAAERPGVYCRVLREGPVQPGETVTLVRYGGDRITVLEAFRQFFDPHVSEATIRRYLAVPIAIRDREAKEHQLRGIKGVRSEG